MQKLYPTGRYYLPPIKRDGVSSELFSSQAQCHV